jgi:hypothetical protein
VLVVALSLPFASAARASGYPTHSAANPPPAPTPAPPVTTITPTPDPAPVHAPLRPRTTVPDRAPQSAPPVSRHVHRSTVFSRPAPATAPEILPAPARVVAPRPAPARRVHVHQPPVRNPRVHRSQPHRATGPVRTPQAQASAPKARVPTPAGVSFVPTATPTKPFSPTKAAFGGLLLLSMFLFLSAMIPPRAVPSRTAARLIAYHQVHIVFLGLATLLMVAVAYAVTWSS